MTEELYADREAINPRAFAVRHLVIQEVKFRKASAAGAPFTARLERVARGVDVAYHGGTHELVVCCEEREVRRIPLDGMTLFARGDGARATQRRSDDARRWDEALEENRRFARTLVDEMLATLAPSRP